VLDARGECGGEIWLAAGSSYKFVLEDAPEYGQTHGPVVSTFDEVTGVNDTVTVPSTNNWIEFTGTPTYISATSFSVSGDQRTTFQVYRRLRSSNSAGTIYSSILTSTYSTGITTVTVLNDTGTLDAGLSSVYYSFVETDPSAIPPPFASGTVMLFVQAAAPFGWTQSTTHNDKALRIVSSAGGGTGGSVSFSGTLNSTTTSNATTLSLSQIPSHNHSGIATSTYGQFSGGPFYGVAIAYGGTLFTTTTDQTFTVTSNGGGGSHTHGVPLNIQYVDSMICIKD
jgi:hypothetical protein